LVSGCLLLEFVSLQQHTRIVCEELRKDVEDWYALKRIDCGGDDDCCRSIVALWRT
jgi:hypothetical protein